MAADASKRRSLRGTIARAEELDLSGREVPEIEELLEKPRDRLLDAAHTLGLTRTSRLRKDQLAQRIREALLARAPGGEAPRGAAAPRPLPAEREVRAAPPPTALPAPEPGPAPSPAGEPKPTPAFAAEPQQERLAATKLDLGVAPEREQPPTHIPWTYGLDRVTAAAVDPDRLFVYWEVTEPAVERARVALGPGGPGAWLNLRLYDTTGRLFDGTNAHSYLDRRVERGDRQWFFDVGKPTSAAVVEIGMMSSEGYFVRIARSGRVDFPRKEPAPWQEPEWMTVLASGETRRGNGVPRRAAPGAPGAPGPRSIEGGGGPQHAPFAQIPAWIMREGGEAVMRTLLEEGWERVEWQLASGGGWSELARRFEWAEPAVVTSWEAGPFTYPVTIEGPHREAWEGGTLMYQANGVTHVVYGPWQIVIRNLGAHTARTELARWEVYRWRVATSGHEVHTVRGAGRVPGASEQVQAIGASERIWLAGSELRLGGASEIWRLGASEVFLRGASERRFKAASEWRLRGASETRLRGASEVRLRGASETRLRGASELRLAGASEQRLGGASERRLGGASEQRLGGASERRLVDGAGSVHTYPSPGAAPTNLE